MCRNEFKAMTFLAQVIIIASLVQWGGVSYDKKPYPGWAEFFGWLLALASMMMIPIFAIVQCYYSKGTTITEVSMLS